MISEQAFLEMAGTQDWQCWTRRSQICRTQPTNMIKVWLANYFLQKVNWKLQTYIQICWKNLCSRWGIWGNNSRTPKKWMRKKLSRQPTRLGIFHPSVPNSNESIQTRTICLEFPDLMARIRKDGYTRQNNSFLIVPLHTTSNFELYKFHLKGWALRWYQWVEKSRAIYDWPDFASTLVTRFRPTEFEIPWLFQQSSANLRRWRLARLIWNSSKSKRSI